MKYENCLASCLRYANRHTGEKDIYRSYPRPTDEEWGQCLFEAKMCEGSNAESLAYMNRYEVLLAKKGVKTVSEQKVAMTLNYLLYTEGIPTEILRAMVRRVSTLTPYKKIRFDEHEW